MTNLIIYSALSVFSLALPLYFYKHSIWVVLGASLAEFVCIFLIYGSTFLMCREGQACNNAWAISAIPALIAAMNIGMVWPILAGYAKQAEKLRLEEES